MRTIIITGKQISDLRVCEFGYAEDTKDTFWRGGYRNQYIIHYVLAGKGYYNGNPVHANQGFIIEPQTNCEYHYDSEEPWKYFWMKPEGSLALDICKNHITADENYIFEYNFPSFLFNLAEKILFDTSKTILSETAALSHFFKIISLHNSTLDSEKNQYVENAKNYIELNMHRQISIKDIAAIQNISDRYLYNLFIKHEGVSPKQYLSDVRLKFAKNMLETSDLSITNIADSVGYNDVLAFSKFFSSHVGISPSDYKSKSKKK